MRKSSFGCWSRKILTPWKLRILRPLMNKPIQDVRDLVDRVKRLEDLGREVTIYPDAEEYIQKALYLATN